MSSNLQATATSVRKQALFDAMSWLRNGEQALLTLVIPIAVLIAADRGPLQIDHAWALSVCAALLASNFTGLAISTAFERRAGALKIYALSPLGRSGYIQSRLLTALLIAVLQFAVISAAAVMTGIPIDSPWTPAVMPLALCVWIPWALFLASALRAEAVLAVANLLFLLIGATASLSIINPLGAAIAAANGSAIGFAIEAAWALVGIAVVSRTFRWE